MGSGHHHRRRSPSPYSEDSTSSSGRSSERRPHRSNTHKSTKSTKPKSSPRDPPPFYSSGGHDRHDRRERNEQHRPNLNSGRRRPELNRSLSEDTYRQVTGNHVSRSNTTRGGREHKDRDDPRRSRRHRSDDDDDYYYYDKHGRAHTRSLSDRSRSRSSSRSRGRDHGHDRDDKPPSSLSSLKPVVEDVMAAFGLVTAKHAKDDHRDGHSSGRSRGYGHDDGGRTSRSRSEDRYGGGSRKGHNGHHEYMDSLVDPNKMPNSQTAALRAAITAAALEAFRTRKEFGGITPERLLRIAGAAIAAGGLDAIVQRDKNSKGGGGGGLGGGNTRELVESVIGGMKSSSAFGHRIRRKHGMSGGDQMKYRLMQAATTKLLDRPLGAKDRSLRPKDGRSRSSTRLSSLMRSMAVQ